MLHGIRSGVARTNFRTLWKDHSSQPIRLTGTTV